MSTSDFSKKIKKQLQSFSVQSYMYQSKIAHIFDLHPTDMLAIHYLDQKGELTAGRLGALLGLTSGATTTAIDRLVKSGFVSRESHTGDRRRIYVRLDQTRIKKLKAKYSIIDKQLTQILQQYSEGDLQVITKFLDTLADQSR